MSDIDQSLEQLLGEASPRPVPGASAAAAARDAVHAEWLQVSGRRRKQQKLMHYAVAATVLLGVFAALNSLRAPSIETVNVASIEKSFGSIFVLGEQSQLTLASDLAAVHKGQTIVTGDNAGIALAWGSGGSVRLDKNTELKFKDAETVYLKSGQIYFDSIPSDQLVGARGADVAKFEVETDFGLVSHAGTQFLTAVVGEELKVTVREGKVDVSGHFYDYRAMRGEQVVFEGSREPIVSNYPEFGSAWDWIGHTTPLVSVDGKSAHEFLHWAGRELGREVVFENAAVEEQARKAKLRGEIDMAPRDALGMRMATTGIAWKIFEEKIYVGDSD